METLCPDQTRARLGASHPLFGNIVGGAVTLLLGASVGYGVAWMIHHERWRDREDVPDYARTRNDFTPYRR
jgi:hypothetical protein